MLFPFLLLVLGGASAAEDTADCSAPVNTWAGLYSQMLTQVTEYPPGSTTSPLEVHVGLHEFLVTNLDQTSKQWKGGFEVDMY